METVSIQTSQNVAIDYPVAGLGDRVLALLIDYGVLLGYLFGVVILMGALSGVVDGNSTVAVVLWLAVYLPFLVYDLVCEIFLNGQSIGKKVMHIKVVKLDGTQPSIGNYFLRWILRPIDLTFSFGLVALVTYLVNGRGQRVGDLAAGTTVVKIKREVTLDDTILVPVGENYQPTFPQVVELSDADIGMIRDVLKVRTQQNKIAQHLAYKAKSSLEQKMGLKSDMLPTTFLETVLRDYNYFRGRVGGTQHAV